MKRIKTENIDKKTDSIISLEVRKRKGKKRIAVDLITNMRAYFKHRDFLRENIKAITTGAYSISYEVKREIIYAIDGRHDISKRYNFAVANAEEIAENMEELKHFYNSLSGIFTNFQDFKKGFLCEFSIGKEEIEKEALNVVVAKGGK